jgi:biotin synthase
MGYDLLASRVNMLAEARGALASGCKWYCMNLFIRSLAEGPGFGPLLDTLQEVRAMGLEVCVCLRFIPEQQARGLNTTGCENQNLDPNPSGPGPGDSSPIHALEPRLADLQAMMEAGIQICFGFILGLAGTREDRLRCLHTLAHVEVLPKAPPIHIAVTILGKFQVGMSPVPATEAIRLIATARILFPSSRIRLTTDRDDLSPKALALASLCGASSISTGSGLMPEPEHGMSSDQVLLKAGRVPGSGVRAAER